MKEGLVAKAYAQALVELAEKDNVDFATEITNFNILINENNNFETLLFLDVFTIDEKKLVLKEVFEKSNYAKIVSNFLYFLLDEKRMGLFPLIYKEVLVRDDDKRGFLRGTIEGYDENINDETKEILKNYLSQKMGLSAKLEYKQNANISAGFKVTVGDLQLDASLDRQLDYLKTAILE